MTQQMNVNTEFSESQANRASFALLSKEAAQHQAADIVGHANRQEILLETVFEKLSAVRVADTATSGAVDAIEAFVTCALRFTILMREAACSITEIAVQEGGAA